MSSAPQPVIISGIDLADVVRRPGPFATAYVNLDATTGERLGEELAGEVSADLARRMVDALLGFETARSTDAVAACVVGTGDEVWVFPLTDPLHRDAIRFGGVPSLGTLVEASQMMPPHAVVTQEGGIYGLTTFGSSFVRPEEFASAQSFDEFSSLLEVLAFVRADQIMVAGRSVEARALVDELADAFPMANVEWIDLPLDADEALAEQIVRNAASLGSERISYELGVFRAARASGMTVEDDAVLPAIEDGLVGTVLLHDDPDDDRHRGNERLVDLVSARTIVTATRLVMIPAVGDENGPAGGIGGVLEGTAHRPATDAEVAQSGPAAVIAQVPMGATPTSSRGEVLSRREAG